MRAKIAAKLVGLRAAADALRAKHSAEDDERTAAADAAARKLAAKEEAVRVRSSDAIAAEGASPRYSFVHSSPAVLFCE